VYGDSEAEVVVLIGQLAKAARLIITKTSKPVWAFRYARLERKRLV
jgi:hypothetical protein